MESMLSFDARPMSGAGNTFVLLDGRELPTGLDLAELARRLCSEGEGYDGLIVVEPSQEPGIDFLMRYHNRDGSSGMMCGNGGRCAVRRAVDLGIAPVDREIVFTNAGIRYSAALTPLGVRVSFPDPRDITTDIDLVVDGRLHHCHFADVGTPHVVSLVDESGVAVTGDVATLDLERLGPPLRRHERFAPEGANANFVQVTGEGIRLRTFERGVEGETGACGTGAVASAILAAKLRGLTPPIDVATSSGAHLRVDFRIEGDRVRDVSLEGPAEYGAASLRA